MRVKEKEELFRSLLVHPKIKAIRSFGLWMAVEFDSFETNKKIIDACIENGCNDRLVFICIKLFAYFSSINYFRKPNYRSL